MSEFGIRWLSQKDAEELSEMAVPLVRASYPYADQEVIERFLNKELSAPSILKLMGNGMNYGMIEKDGETAGFFAYSTEDETIHLDKLYVLDEFRHTGTGTWTMEWLFNVAKSQGYRNIELTVVDLNVPAIRFYKKLGFTRIGPERGYAVKRSVMKKTFKSAELFSFYNI